jgi:ligand-binding sensor domain-containing protein
VLAVMAASSFLSDISYAQVQNLRIENLNVGGGLSQALVNYIYQDKDDFIWVSTDAGVQTYDGFNFKDIA